MSKIPKKITPKQNAAIRALLGGAKMKAAAGAAGVTVRTLSRWLQDDVFIAELRKAEMQLLEVVGWRLVALSGRAVDALSDVLDSPSSRGASIKRLTAQTILKLLLSWRDQMDLEERILALEARQNE